MWERRRESQWQRRRRGIRYTRDPNTSALKERCDSSNESRKSTAQGPLSAHNCTYMHELPLRPPSPSDRLGSDVRSQAPRRPLCPNDLPPRRASERNPLCVTAALDDGEKVRECFSQHQRPIPLSTSTVTESRGSSAHGNPVLVPTCVSLRCPSQGRRSHPHLSNLSGNDRILKEMENVNDTWLIRNLRWNKTPTDVKNYSSIL